MWEEFTDPRFPWLIGKRRLIHQSPYNLYLCVYKKTQFSSELYQAILQMDKTTLLANDIQEIVVGGWHDSEYNALKALFEQIEVITTELQEIRDELGI